MHMPTLILAASMGVACALLSVIVVLRRWAFIGEGISHAGFGGIGSAWLLSLAFPLLESEAAAYLVAVGFCVGVALAIAYVTQPRGHEEKLASDSAIGIFMVASLAWGFVALRLYRNARPGGPAADWERYLFGEISTASSATAMAAVVVMVIVLMAVFALLKEIMAYSFDPQLARISGVRTALVHYLLMLMLALVIVIGMRLAGNILITALLVLPGATALLLSRRLYVVLALSIASGLAGSVGGIFTQHYLLPTLPVGPAIVLALFALFLCSLLIQSVLQKYPWRSTR